MNGSRKFTKTLGTRIDTENIDAKIEDGILKMRVRFLLQREPTKIAVS